MFLIKFYRTFLLEKKSNEANWVIYTLQIFLFSRLAGLHTHLLKCQWVEVLYCYGFHFSKKKFFFLNTLSDLYRKQNPSVFQRKVNFFKLTFGNRIKVLCILVFINLDRIPTSSSMFNLSFAVSIALAFVVKTATSSFSCFCSSFNRISASEICSLRSCNLLSSVLTISFLN